jgi:hypothetical protein
VDQPTARRRRHASSTNSLTVAELQAKSTPAERASISAIQAKAAAEAQTRTEAQTREAQAREAQAQARDAQTMTAPLPAFAPPALARTLNLPAVIPEEADDEAEPVRPEDLTDEPRTSTRLARTIVMMLVAIVGCGVVTAVAALGGERPQRLSPNVPVVQPAIMTGPAVVRLDRVLGELSSAAPTTSPLPSPPAATLPQAPLASHNAASKVVTDFYSDLPKQAKRAFELLAPAMQGDGVTTFEDGWEDVREVVPTILPAQDEAVWVRVSVEEKVLPARNLTGELYQLTLRIEVRAIRVEGAPQLRIVGAQLLSAHRS